MAASVNEIRRVLKIYDDSAIAPVNRAITMLSEVTKLISEKPEAYDLTSYEAEAWKEAGGYSYGDNYRFPSLVGARWIDVLSKSGLPSSAGLDKDEWSALLQKLTEYEAKLGEADLTLEEMDLITHWIVKLRERAPDPEDDSDDDDDDDD
ncbi:hypothetical protein VOLCADRAFT_107024 [Volvox carteri f. nagariensis]|uniref:Uncharacterized protein n=1 Tax=Volvox carteri f. nagariensis TaxID=3068 RepID=D8UBD7_VOLCA|nr:uncharacterized protein VOLCADRAFT_107024 [Volvox carteri f. nagariensis]EFJ42931.1 hypothetical protein VOLCADRAFT_107024 [Volvox carteri f. nagariensis]|eukprot:XP_002955971.1 hypothetical protein VOLCADRAFT_107024 [Volvox carteri f. nagariensis]